MYLFKVKDTLTDEIFYALRESEDMLWASLCDIYGSGYVFENMKLLSYKRA